MVAARGGLNAFQKLQLPVAELSINQRLHVGAAAAGDAARGSDGTLAPAASPAPSSAQQPMAAVHNSSAQAPTGPASSQAMAAAEAAHRHAMLDLTLLPQLDALHMPDAAVSSKVMLLLAGLGGLRHLHAGKIDAVVPRTAVLSITSLRLQGGINLKFLPPSNTITISDRHSTAAPVKAMAVLMPALQELDCMPDDLTALAWRLNGHPTLTALTTRTSASLRSEAWPAQKVLFGAIPHLAKVTLLGLALSGDGPDLLLQDLSQCSCTSRSAVAPVKRSACWLCCPTCWVVGGSAARGCRLW